MRSHLAHRPVASPRRARDAFSSRDRAEDVEWRVFLAGEGGVQDGLFIPIPGATCPSLTTCSIQCETDNVSCTSSVTCSSGSICDIHCDADHSCDSNVNITCSPGSVCNIYCKGTHSCDAATVQCPSGAQCIYHCCGTSACNPINCGASGCMHGTDTCQ